MYAAIYCVGQLVVFRRWAPRQRLDGASCLISLFHGTPAALAAAGSSSRCHRSTAPSHAAQLRASKDPPCLDYSVAYIHHLDPAPLPLPSCPENVSHRAPPSPRSFVFSSTCPAYKSFRQRPRTRSSSLLVLAEVTSLLQNVLDDHPGLAGSNPPRPRRSTASSSTPYPNGASYHRSSGGRRPALPPQDGRLLTISGHGQSTSSRGGCGSLGLLCWHAIAVSNLWIWNLWKELFSERNQAVERQRKTPRQSPF
ncbi:hypothetical protein HU200_058453 [Digitaria exilis]|uniref:Uncharacterized protein n=1 Tax=Digitaria exilis TaxID=1010633 RepID=A0A835E3D9_9POAL|nr:hypothetical protein HU200_058453 [Digitaria exilis]